MRTPAPRNFPRLQTFAANLILILLLAPAIAAQTQSTTGDIQGTVQDANGAVVPGANVEIKNVDTGSTRSLVTDEGGRFVALALQPGKYSVKVSKQSFASAEDPNVQVTVGKSLDLIFNLKPGGIDETVTVTATPTVDTVKTEVSTTHERNSSRDHADPRHESLKTCSP